jgi:2,3-bisphosphoglycerate-dependent phosphoglycerate mutase
MIEQNFFQFVLLRHGQSRWNLENRFTGWTDIPLTDLGRAETRRAAHLLKHAGFSFDFACTSVLERAVESLSILTDEMDSHKMPIMRDWRLNERHYGCLQGLNKSDTSLRLGELLVRHWRRSYAGRPPALEFDDHRHPRFDPLYAGLPVEYLPATESLQDTEARVSSFWETIVRPLIQGGLCVLILAHGNSLRALVRILEQTPVAQVPDLNIPTGVPLIYRTNFELSSFQLLDRNRIGNDPQR